ncbi:hypothetical protein DFP72DRAFT_827272 [Ephemerocybe angulata]|uniref:CxC2-like cysteine cluster KDZ transposase-associated domain-containing protein n=1 Tax=Ephemerocybe angulata TaxID=980116 RepID=A0A8H6HAX4_9AGAR|nr:hypothetical protein DFP72DRAFT_827272 [Tulosesus angulatus]
MAAAAKEAQGPLSISTTSAVPASAKTTPAFHPPPPPLPSDPITPASLPPTEPGSAKAVAPSKDTTGTEDSEDSEKGRSVLQQFEREKDRLIQLLLKGNADPDVLKPCLCGRSGHRRTTRCKDCLHYRISCSECFVESHRSLPTHWAEVWSESQGFFVRHDISTLGSNASFQLGHGTRKCPNPTPPRTFILVDTNGIHSTLVSFCNCVDAEDHCVQLMGAKLFPATFVDPKMAFTFNLMESFRCHHLESAETVSAFCSALSHLTDDVFFNNVPDTSTQLRNASKFWRILQTTIQLGQAHDIDSVITTRPPGQLLVRCPTCPEFKVNIDADELDIPAELRHLIQYRDTADGNYHAGHLIKNNDLSKFNASLFGGRAQFPNGEDYKRVILGKLETDSQEKFTCSYLNAVNKQDKKKFKGMDISGVVNYQCSHILILSSVDLQCGERRVATLSSSLSPTYPNVLDLPIDGTINMSDSDKKFLEACSFLFSYDIACAFEPNIHTRMAEKFPDVAEVVRRYRFLIPLVHVQNHKDNCTYQYSSAYVLHAAHFHGEQAEHPWSYVNLFGPQCRQMNHGNRHDTYIGVYNHWNWKKVINMSSQLRDEVLRAAILKDEKRETFLSLTKLYHNRVAEWDKLDRNSPKKNAQGEILSVYRHNPSKVPSQDRIYQMMIKQTYEDLPVEKRDSATQISKPILLNRAITIWKLQYKTQSKMETLAAHPDKGLRVEVDRLKDDLQKRIKLLRRDQKALTPQLLDHIAVELSKPSNLNVETMTLFLPSDFTHSDRVKFSLLSLADGERKMLEGAAYDVLSQLRRDVQFYDSLTANKKSQCYGQERHTREQSKVDEARRRRNSNMDLYKKIRSALVRLGMPEDDPTFLPLTLESLFRKSTTVKRAIGDTYTADSMLWTSGKRVAKSKRRLDGGSANKSTAPNPSHVSVPIPLVETDDPVSVNTTEGWIWKVTTPRGMSDKEVEEWLSEGDRVQWFRAEAEMYRWQEEWEQKLAELLRTAKYFSKMSSVWTDLGKKTEEPGKLAFAFKIAAQYNQLRRISRTDFKATGFPHIEKFTDLVTELVKYRQKLKSDILAARTPQPPARSHP